MVTPPGIEPGLPPWKGDVLTAWPWGQNRTALRLRKAILSQNRQWPIFPGSRPPSIFGAEELNFCVRDGYRWILFAIITGFHSLFPLNSNNEKSFLSHFSPIISFSWLSFRSISIGQLHTLLHFHLRPI